ncbi:MAG: 6-bladed beta-propeller [Muribaculaceae bacterium]|nr:6-bladed beta-propeller [Muribaculaceae bacterium]
MKTRTYNIGLAIMAITLILLQSCHKSMSDGENTPAIKIPVGKSTWTKLSFDSLFEYDRYVILEANDESLIRHIDKLYKTSERIFILDSFKRILIFDNNGRYVKTIDHTGNGPNEYVKLQDFDLEGDTLYILDSQNERILKYSTDDKFIASLDGKKAQGLIKFGGDTVAYNIGFGYADGEDGNDYSYSLITPQHSQYAICFNNAMLGRVYSHSGALPFYKPDCSGYLMALPFNGTIYAIDEATMMPTSLVNITIGDEKREINSSTSQNEVESIIKSDVTKVFYSIYRWGDDLFFGYDADDSPFVYAIVDLNGGQIKLNQAFRPDKNGFPIMPYSYMTDLRESQKLMSVVDPIAIR